MAALPALRFLAPLVHRLVGEELLRVELAAYVLDPDVVDLIQHLVKHKPHDEEPRHELAIERAMDADQAILDGIAAHLDRVAAARPAGLRAPSDQRVDLVREVARVEIVVDRAQIVMLARGEDHLRRLAARAAADVARVAIDEVAEDPRRLWIV